jgi:hypothetical protein
MARGYIKIRNEDGTQWLSFFKPRNSRGRACWSWDFSKKQAKVFDKSVFDQLKIEQQRSVQENGYVGMYNLKFVEV